MIGDVACAEEPVVASDRLFEIVAFRTFSKIATWEGLKAELGGRPTITHLADGSFKAALDRIKGAHSGLYTGAFILCANKAFGYDEKHHNHVALFNRMFVEDNLARRLLDARSLKMVVELLQSYPLMGPFMAYQTAVDLNYSDLLAFSENDFTQAGPGALRGIRKAFEDPGDYSPEEIILWMTEQQHREFDHLGLPFNGLFGRPLHAIDCQGLFCELDKYCREAAPELSSARSRIKARYTPSCEPITLAFPRTWGLCPTARVLPPPRSETVAQLCFALDDPRPPAAGLARGTPRIKEREPITTGDLFLR